MNLLEATERNRRLTRDSRNRRLTRDSGIVVSLVIPVFRFPFRKKSQFFFRKNFPEKNPENSGKNEKPQISSCAIFFFWGGQIQNSFFFW